MRKLIVTMLWLVSFSFTSQAQAESWQQVQYTGSFVPRHEAGFIGYNDMLYLIGGRRINPVNVFDPKTLNWSEGAKPPFQMHHFQPAVWQDRIVVAGAMTEGFPNEKPVSHLYYYFPATDEWQQGPAIPEHRQRGGAGVVIVGNELFLLGGIINGHMGGFVTWADSYNFNTGIWTELADAPHPRDHFQATELNNRIYLAGGRTTSFATKDLFNLVVPQVDVLNLENGQWQVLEMPLPTPRAGNSVMAFDGEIWVAGGESARPGVAHNEVEIYSPASQQWRTSAPLIQGRHGTGLVYAQGYLWTVSGSGKRGGSPELNSMERLKVD